MKICMKQPTYSSCIVLAGVQLKRVGVRNCNAMTPCQIQPRDISENRRSDSYHGYQLHTARLWHSLYTLAGLKGLRPFITTVCESQG